MTEKATLARPYARAAFEFAHERGCLPQWSELLGAASLVVSDARVARLLGSPHVTDDDLVSLVADAAGAAADEHARNYLRALAHNRRLGLLPDITAQYETLRAQTENIADVELAAAMQVAPAQLARLEQALKRRLGCDIRIKTRIDASLIGGAVVRAGDLVIDGSLKSRLKRLATAMTA